MKTLNPNHLPARHNLRFISLGFAVTKHAVTSSSEGGDAHDRWDAPRGAESGWPALSIPLQYCFFYRLQLCGMGAGGGNWGAFWKFPRAAHSHNARRFEICVRPTASAGWYDRGTWGALAERATSRDRPPVRICCSRPRAHCFGARRLANLSDCVRWVLLR